MNRHIKTALAIVGIIIIILTTAFCTYRFVMTHQSLERGDNGNIHSTVFGHTDTYYVEPQADPTARIMDELYDEFCKANEDGKYTITREDPYTINIGQ